MKLLTVLIMATLACSPGVLADVFRDATNGDVAAVTTYLNNGCDVNAVDRNGATALHHAVAGNRIEVVRLLLAHKADVNAHRNDGVSPLHMAVIRGFADIRDLLLAAGARKDRWMTVSGIVAIEPYESGQQVTDAIMARYRFHVARNSGPNSFKIIFGAHRVRGTEKQTYAIETNLYTDGMRYSDLTQAGFPPKGQRFPAEACLRVGLADYAKRGRMGAKTADPTMFPRQTSLIDGIPGLFKIDLVSQQNLNGKDVLVEVARGGLITDKTGWKCNGEPLGDEAYREWSVAVAWDTKEYKMSLALPDGCARYLVPEFEDAFGSEFLSTQGPFSAYFWDMQVYRESTQRWQPITRVRIKRQQGDDSGVRLAHYQGLPVVEFTNDHKGSFLPLNSVIDLSNGTVSHGGH